MQTPRTLEQRMEDFVDLFGAVPAGARKLEDYEARRHSDTWIQRLLGDGIVCHYVIGYQLDGRWWTFCFDRREPDCQATEDEEELWIIEAYDSSGASWRDTFLHNPSLPAWRRVPEHDSRHALGTRRTARDGLA